MEGIIVVLLVDNTSGAAGRSGSEKFRPDRAWARKIPSLLVGEV